jgi:3-phenylpropionate/cinnamic acid dioxygenase small subunit
MKENTTRRPVNHDIYIAVQRFLNREADCLDRRAYREWLALCSDDIQYRVTAQVSQELTAGQCDYALINEDASGLKARVDQISDARLTHAENPPTLARRFLSNLQVEHGDAPDEFLASSNILVYRTRPQFPEGAFYVGSRRDVIRLVNGDWRLMRRVVCLDQTIFFGGVSTLF